jgi:hypothetical protein
MLSTVPSRCERHHGDMNGGHLGRKHRLELIVRLDAGDHGKHEIKPVLIKPATFSS